MSILTNNKTNVNAFPSIINLICIIGNTKNYEKYSTTIIAVNSKLWCQLH